MEEKVLIKSKQYNVKKFCNAMILTGVVLTVLALLTCFIDVYNYRYNLNPSKSISLLILDTLDEMFYWDWIYWLCFIPLVAFPLIGGLIYLWLRSYELTVTDKRIYGKVAWGRRVDLPVDSVSATATTSVLKGVSVATSSGRISFLVMKNAKEIYEVINNLLLERQNSNKPANATTVIQQNSDEVDKLKKYKDLLDNGVITQEEFDAKKKQLLGL